MKCSISNCFLSTLFLHVKAYRIKWTWAARQSKIYGEHPSIAQRSDGLLVPLTFRRANCVRTVSGGSFVTTALLSPFPVDTNSPSWSDWIVPGYCHLSSWILCIAQDKSSVDRVVCEMQLQCVIRQICFDPVIVSPTRSPILVYDNTAVYSTSRFPVVSGCTQGRVRNVVLLTWDKLMCLGAKCC